MEHSPPAIASLEGRLHRRVKRLLQETLVVFRGGHEAHHGDILLACLAFKVLLSAHQSIDQCRPNLAFNSRLSKGEAWV